MSDKYKYELPNIKEGIKLLMDYPNLIIRRYNREDYNNESKLIINNNGELCEEVFKIVDYESERHGFKYYPINIIDDSICWVSGYDEDNFFYVCNKILNLSTISDLKTIYNLLRELLDNETTIELKKFMKDVYWIYLNDMIDNDKSLNKEEKYWIDELLDN